MGKHVLNWQWVFFPASQPIFVKILDKLGLQLVFASFVITEALANGRRMLPKRNLAHQLAKDGHFCEEVQNMD
jgi:hypothetical protein